MMPRNKKRRIQGLMPARRKQTIFKAKQPKINAEIMSLVSGTDVF